MHHTYSKMSVCDIAKVALSFMLGEKWVYPLHTPLAWMSLVCGLTALLLPCTSIPNTEVRVPVLKWSTKTHAWIQKRVQREVRREFKGAVTGCTKCHGRWWKSSTWDAKTDLQSRGCPGGRLVSCHHQLCLFLCSFCFSSVCFIRLQSPLFLSGSPYLDLVYLVFSSSSLRCHPVSSSFPPHQKHYPP